MGMHYHCLKNPCGPELVLCILYSYPVAEQAMKARKEIADYIKSGRIERARIRVSKDVTMSCYVEGRQTHPKNATCIHKQLPNMAMNIIKSFLVPTMSWRSLSCTCHQMFCYG